MEFLDLGTLDYRAAYLKQKECVEERHNGRLSNDLILFVEHPEVYTFGRKYKDAIPSHLKNVEVVERGGDATFHNPGQLVGYPIFKLADNDLHRHLRFLETLIVEVLKKFEIQGESREKKTGVWIVGKEKKIASIGVAVKNWVTYHGFALNVSNDLSGFARINPCGFDASVMTSIQEETRENITMDQVKREFIQLLQRGN